jgi:hypothetical protein|tara:strand:- start:611 stop:1339 length:729 start_codon:yes stop_codon:yes gene_type:complete
MKIKNRRNFIKLGSLAALGLRDTAIAESPSKKTFIHGFNFKFKKGVPEKKIAGMMSELAALKEKIPVLKDFLVGKNIAPRTHGYQYGEIAVFDKKEDLMVYERHPEHEKLVKKILPHLEIGNGMDFFPIGNAKTELGTSSYKGHFIHAFNFKFKNGVSNDEIAELMSELASMKEKIPVLKELLIGKNVAHWHRGFQYGEIAVFEKKEDLKIFDKHPEHQKLVKKIIPKLDSGHAMDFIPIDA